MAQLTLTTVNIGAPDPGRLARFYEQLLGWPVRREEADDVYLSNPAGGITLSFQRETDHARPTWPADPGDQQMQMHLEVMVDDLEAGLAHAIECGAELAEFQPQDDVWVCLDPAGHPFCLYVD